MRDTCIGCASLETRDGKPYCFWYDHVIEDGSNVHCGNDFEEKPEFNQEELELIVYDPKYEVATVEQLDKWADEKNWDKIYDDVEKCKEKFREERKMER